MREENESLTAMLCSKEEELNRTKAAVHAIREERDRLRRRVSMPCPASLGLAPRLWGREKLLCRPKGSSRDSEAFIVFGIAISCGCEVILERKSNSKVLQCGGKIFF